MINFLRYFIILLMFLLIICLLILIFLGIFLAIRDFINEIRPEKIKVKVNKKE